LAKWHPFRPKRPIFGWYFWTLLCRIPRLSDESLALPRGGANAFWCLHPARGAPYDGFPSQTCRGPLEPSTFSHSRGKRQLFD
jgi:hypothetical protein